MQEEQTIPPLRSVHTVSFAEILDEQKISLAVTTYQAGKLVLLRAERSGGSGGAAVLNTHFRSFSRPMGLAYEKGRFALGTGSEVWEFHDLPAVARKLNPGEPGAAHDAAFLPRTCHFTGDVQVHEMLWQPGASSESAQARLSELWFINTRFSCLCTRSEQYSFTPRWHPPFITALAPEDRCHLNGVCLREGKIRYVTALGTSDVAGGWREKKSTGGVLMEVPSGDILCSGLSMPHSPRWHDGKLWVLESGNGGVGFVEQTTGKFIEIRRLPGFTRGLDFAGHLAFVGLSQVRETATFSGIHVAEIPQEQRCCGVWIIDLRNGQIVGFVKFTDALQEIFAVQILPGIRWPEVLSEDARRIADTYELPDRALQQVPIGLRDASVAPQQVSRPVVPKQA